MGDGPHTHTYRTELAWVGSTGVGYDAYDRAHRVDAAPAEAALDLSSDPAFRGDPARLNPEQLLVAAASSCQLLSFLAVAARARLDVVGYAAHIAAQLGARVTVHALRAGRRADRHSGHRDGRHGGTGGPYVLVRAGTPGVGGAVVTGTRVALGRSLPRC